MSPFLRMQHVSSTYCFHNLGLEGANSTHQKIPGTVSLFIEFTTIVEVDLRHMSSNSATLPGESGAPSARLSSSLSLAWMTCTASPMGTLG